MIIIIDVKWRDFGRDILSVVVCEFGEWKKLTSILLLIIAEYL
jgi:hypothetical protein